MKTLTWQCWVCGRWQRDVNPHKVTIELVPLGPVPPGMPAETFEVWLCGDCLTRSKPAGEGH